MLDVFNSMFLMFFIEVLKHVLKCFLNSQIYAIYNYDS